MVGRLKWFAYSVVAYEYMCGYGPMARSLGMLGLLTAGRGGMVEMWRKWVFSLFRKSEGLGREVVGDGVKNSPGKRRVVP